MNVDLSGEVLTSRDIGHTVLFRTSGGYTITIESQVTVESTAGTYHASPSPDTAHDLAVWLEPLLRQPISSSGADAEGGLDISFHDGARLHVDPDENYEAWTITSPDGGLVVSGPGGDIAEWHGEPR